MESIVKMLYDVTVRLILASLEWNLLPDAVIRRLTRLLLARRLRSGYKPSAIFVSLVDLSENDNSRSVICSLREMPIAIKVTISISLNFLFSYHKHHSCRCLQLDLDKSSTLEDAEKAMLELRCGHRWRTGSRSSRRDRRRFERTEKQATEGIFECMNVDIVVADISTFDVEASYDRIFSIAMFEHMKNYRDLLKKISRWMKPDGLLFVQYFCHKTFAHHFEDVNGDDWVSRYFFNGSTMPSANLLLYFQNYDWNFEVMTSYCWFLLMFNMPDDVCIADHWLVNGKHYAQTCEGWLKRMDLNSNSVKPIMESTYGKDSAVKWTVYWRTIFIGLAEVFAYNDGEEWMVSHFLFRKK
ncbi:Hypothetical predicted protein [Olea europaea subsp. europaea]|uniref:Uncharacterized protein n=1 Tax=Olea europaea subsp. europaea TaxID=158383 RepID=A0A8S0SY96_OLEEU|nr:Hypothetical predicted protein [Olea europaea subsp. europaea]